MFGKLNDKEIEEMMHHQILGRIGCHADGVTYVVPISYVYDGVYVYGHTFEGMKINLLRKNPKVCFQVDSTKNLANWESVIGWGEFEELQDPELCKEALQKLNERKLPVIHSKTMQISSLWPFTDEDDEKLGIFFRIKLGDKTGRFERGSDEYFFAT